MVQTVVTACPCLVSPVMMRVIAMVMPGRNEAMTFPTGILIESSSLNGQEKR